MVPVALIRKCLHVQKAMSSEGGSALGSVHETRPVLYHESLNFIGFVGSWEDFATTNNLQLPVRSIPLVHQNQPLKCNSQKFGIQRE